MASVIISFLASAIFIAISSFTKKRGFYYILFSSLTLVSLAVTMILSANYNNNFFGFSIISIVSLAPLFIILFDFKSRLDGSEIKYQRQQDNITTQSEQQPIKTKRRNITLLFHESEGRLFESLALFLSAFFVAFSGLYLGKVSPFGMLTCLPAGLIGLSVTYLKNREANVFDVVSNALSYAGAGILVGQIISVLIHSFNASSILYILACLAMASYMVACVYTKERRINVILYCVYLMLAIAILVY